MGSGDSEATDAARHRAGPWRPDILTGRHCLLVTFRASGAPVPTPVWVASVDDSIVLRTDAASAKVRRIARRAEVLIGPCDPRGRPTGPTMEGRAEILAGDAARAAERALAERHGFLRRVYAATLRRESAPAFVAIRQREGSAARD